MLGLRGVVAVLAVVGIAVAIGIIIPGHAARAATAEPLDEQGDPLKLIHKAEVLSELSADKPLRLAITGAFEEPKAGSQLKFFYTSHSHYGGPITPAAIEKVLAAHKGEALEHRLSAPAMERLRAELIEFDTALRDTSLLIDENEERAKVALRQRPDRCIVIPTRPRERDPAYARLVAAQAELPPSEGTTWGEPYQDGERHLIVRWTEWPGLRAMYDDRIYMILERDKRVRAWIEREYLEHGQECFVPD